MKSDLITNNLYNNIKYLFMLNGVKISEVEKAIGVSVGYFARTRQNGNFDLPITKVVAIAEYFKIDIYQLVFGNFKKVYLEVQAEKINRELQEIQ